MKKLLSFKKLMLEQLDTLTKNKCFDTRLVPYSNINSKRIADLNTNPKSIKFLEEHAEENHYDSGLGNYFLDTVLKA